MTTEKTPADHRSVLQELLIEMPMAETKEALRWALEMTQEPAPPPGGWTQTIPDAEACVQFLADLSRSLVPPGWEESAVQGTKAIYWALPILRRAAGVKTDLMVPQDPSATAEPLCPRETRSVKTDQSSTIDPLNSLMDLCNICGEWLTITAGTRPPGTNPPWIELRSEDLRASLLSKIQRQNPIQSELASLRASEEQTSPTAEPDFLASLQTMATHIELQPHHRRAVAWALRRLEAQRAEPKIDTPALTALAKREIRFWEEAAEVSGKVTSKAATRAIRGLKGVLRYLGALPNS